MFIDRTKSLLFELYQSELSKEALIQQHVDQLFSTENLTGNFQAKF